MSLPKKVVETLSLFSVVDMIISKVVVEGVIGISEEQKHEMNDLALKLEELGLKNLASEIRLFLENSSDKKSIRNLMRIITLNRMIKLEYTKAFVVQQMEG
ncbi:MAG: hypothetical protein ACTSPV_17335 [Candidatus Hodarchaeales archaeon]